MNGEEELLEQPPERRKFEVSKPQLSPIEEAYRDARIVAIKRLPSARSRLEHMALTHAARVLTISHGAYAEAHGYLAHVPTPDELVSGHTTDEELKRWEIEQERAAELLRVAMELEAKPGDFRIAVARYGEDFGRDYRALGIYPLGEQADYDLPRSESGGQQGHDVIYMPLYAACSAQAVGAILAAAGDGVNSTGIVLPSFDLSELYSRLDFNSDAGPKQNFHFRNAAGEIIASRDPGQYLMYALKDGFYSERDRYLLNDFREGAKA